MPNNQIDMILSVTIQNGGKVSKRKRGRLAQLVGDDVLVHLEELAERLIKDIKERFGVDVYKMMSEKP